MNKTLSGRMAAAKDDPIEQEALMFAAHLLVPSSQLRALWKQYKDVADLDDFAVMFGTTRDVIGYRLEQEGLWRFRTNTLGEQTR